MKCTLILGIGAVVAKAAAGLAARTPNALTPAAQSLFDFSMSINDPRWDDSYKVLWFNGKGPWNTRFTSWYIPGLLHRNLGDDQQRAIDALEALLHTQMTTDFDSAWYGTFKSSPDTPDPTPDSALFPPEIYTSYDPNWREFIGIQFVQVLEEFEHMLPKALVTKLEDSLEINAVGAMRRNGTYPDNLTLGYSNPAIMRALVVGWIGQRTGNKEYIDFANEQGDGIYDLFTKEGANTLSEYNAPNYYGIDIFALAANIAYGPKNATMTKWSEPILAELWKDIADHYNSYLGNLVGPYDRAYTRDMPSHNSILQFFWWGIFGLDKAPHPPLSDLDLNFDVSQGASMALVMKAAASVLDEETAKRLTSDFCGTRTLRKTVHPYLDKDETRIATSWMSKNLMVGGMEQNETEQREPRGAQFVPALVHWAADPSHKPFPYSGFFSLYPTATSVKAVASASRLVISYPNTTQPGTDTFQFMITGFPPKWIWDGNVVDGFENLPCVKVGVSSPDLERQPTTYGSTIYSHYYYNVTYTVPAGFNGVPTIAFDFEYTC